MIKGWQIFLLGAGFVLGTSCRAEGAAIAKKGVGATPACQTCHGSSGEGNAQAGFPRLANLGAAYMRRQLDAFADGTRVNAVMLPIAKALSVTDRAEVSAYYAALPAPPGPPAPPASPAPAASLAPASASASASASAPVPASASATIGATLATRGRWADKLPACDQCHGPGGRGVGADFPALAGQGAGYLANQLAAWKAGSRPPGPMGLMAAVAKKLSEAEVQAVAAHYASVPVKAAP